MTAPSVLTAHLCDDAALFPPGNAPMPQAVSAHFDHRRADYADIVGPFVVAAGGLRALATELIGRTIEVAITMPSGLGCLDEVDAILRDTPGIRVAAFEIAPEPERSAADFYRALSMRAPNADVYVEIPRDQRSDDYLREAAGSAYAAKFRTGGVTAAAYPDDAELAASIHAAVAAGVRFKATAGLHHAIRNTDLDTGFEQHGFLNVMLATARAQAGVEPDALAEVLADRDGPRVAAALMNLETQRIELLRKAFHSFGTCSITDPVHELSALGVFEPSHTDLLEGHRR